MVPNAVRLLERYIEGLPLSIKGNVTSSKLVDLHEAIDMAQGHYKNKCRNNGSQCGGNQIRSNQQNPQNNQRQNQGNPKGSNQVSTSTQGGHKAPGRVYSLCAEAAVKDNNVVNGERSEIESESRLEVISSMRTQKYINQGCQVFLIQMMKEEKTKIPERRIKDVPILRDFLEVFPEDFPGLPQTRQVEFHIELIPRAAPLARTPYRLAPAEMKELAEQLK
ncbi:hypothetical protein Tco_0233717 [Tanacetum coccineum]